MQYVYKKGKTKGRPKSLDEPLFTYSVRLPAVLARKARRIGATNFSEGVRQAIIDYNEVRLNLNND